MRWCIRVSLVLATLLVTSVAGAQGNNQTTAAPDPEADQSANGSTSSSFTLQQMGLSQKRWWQVGATFETHRLLRQDDLGGAARSKALNYAQLYVGVKPGPRDQFRITGGFYQRFLADGGETGIRGDDLNVSYNHLFSLPWQLSLRPSIGNDIPISFESRLAGLYAVPRASVLLMRNFLDNNLSVSVRFSGAGYISEYKQAVGGGSANPFMSMGPSVGFNYSMPFHQNLQVGASIQTRWYWNHDVEHGGDPTLREQFRNTPIEASNDPQFASQPVQQTYGGEIYIGYQLPNLGGAQSNIQLSIPQGEAKSVNHDGRTAVYWLFRRSAQAYLALQVQY